MDMILDKDTRFEMYPKIQEEAYRKLHTDKCIPTCLKIDPGNFKSTIESYQRCFKTWSNNRSDQLEIRQGLALVNLTGTVYQDEDLTIGPLDYYNKCNPNNGLNETDIREKTELYYESCFDPLRVFDDTIIRSSILKWQPGANFKPHWDLQTPTPHLRLWGTTDPDNIQLRFDNNGVFEPVENIEAGRIYIIDSAIVHDAVCINNIGYQFFIAVASEAYNTMLEIRDEIL